MTKHSIGNNAIIYTYSIIYMFSYKYYLQKQRKPFFGMRCYM